MATYFVSEQNLAGFLEALSKDFEVYGTIERQERLAYEPVKSDNAKLVTFRTVRTFSTPKALLFPAAERVAVYTASGETGKPKIEQPARVIVGLRQCDLSAIHMLDRVMLEGEYVDPFFKARRDATILISTDCVDACPSCFCTMIEGQPYPKQWYDLNFSPLKDGCVAETGSKRGEELVEKHSRFFAPAADAQLRERDESREAIRSKVVEQNREFEPDRPIREVFAGEIDEVKLQKLAWDCVECGACTNICPSCHCFLMFDRPAPVEEGGGKAGETKFERKRAWDSCVFAEYARMAGVGGVKPNPRANFRTRFVNRFLHKYLYFYEMFNQFQCSGCGRCFDACGGGIDPRRIIKEMSKRDDEKKK